ncbi:hypothetical protein [Fundidesulfovibrio agrisoli]|uniref:hypothetical protein n=1 Tax=Fundidesulfovibrio agrisoli TaxID=2922717 RepID=UPI001FADA82F|nr:hypothetical protein [Fundidesulfovibrio agrisoli]
MSTITFDEIVHEPRSLGRRLERLGLRKSIAFGAEIVALANDSLEIALELRECLASCNLPENPGFLLSNASVSAENAAKLRRIYGALPWYFGFVKSKAFKAADAWEDLAEDIQMLASPLQRKALDDLENAAKAAAGHLKDWRQSSLFQ